MNTRTTVLRPLALCLLLVSAPLSMEAQSNEEEFLLNGFYLRGGKLSFNKALVMYDETTEIWLGQAKGMLFFGLGYDYLEKGSWIGCGVGAHYSTTTLNPFAYEQTPYRYAATDVGYSWLLFDGDVYLVPFERLPFAFTVGFTLASSIHGYTLSGSDPTPGTNGKKSFNIFRYGYILGCKIVPLKLLTLEFEYRPMSAYSVTQTYELGDFAFNRDGADWYHIKSTTETEGMSENMFLVSLSIHF
ncbi:MAG: hypothetical protein Q8P51_13610 [Ignavibacteria bacterium]|nr:hypothetical protein [Ignavibacteria bacterium]